MYSAYVVDFVAAVTKQTWLFCIQLLVNHVATICTYWICGIFVRFYFRWLIIAPDPFRVNRANEYESKPILWLSTCWMKTLEVSLSRFLSNEVETFSVFQFSGEFEHIVQNLRFEYIISFLHHAWCIKTLLQSYRLSFHFYIMHDASKHFYNLVG